MRALATPWAAIEVLKDPSLGARITADLSHWVLAAERPFNFPADDLWWPECLELVANNSVLVHARVGSPREIQVADPAAPEFAELLRNYETWWDVIYRAQAKRGGVVRVEAEFGPAPYMPTLPYTEQPVSDLSKAVDYISQRQMNRLIAGECGLVQDEE